MKLTLDQWQKDFLNTKGDKILCTGRQVGKSVICGQDAGEFAIHNPKSEPIVMIAPTERQAYALFEKTLQYLIENYPSKLVLKGQKRPTKTKIELRNGVRIYCLPVGASGIGIRFLTIGRLYVDEASRVPEDVWSAITPALLMTGGDTILLSTPAGAQGEFWRTWINKDKAYNSFTRISIDSEKVVRTRKFCETWTELQREKALVKLEQAKVRMSKKEYAQEYMGEFMPDLHRWFSDDLLRQTCVLKRPSAINKANKHYLGCDIARMGEDEGTYEILEKKKDKLYQVENIVTRKKLTTETEDKILELDKVYDFKFIYIDAGAGTLGVSIFDHLLAHPQTKKKIVAVNNRARSMDRDDQSKTKLVKEDLYGNLLALMEQNQIRLLDDDDVIASLASIQFEYVMKSGEPTKLRIFGNYSHIAEGLIRAAIGIKDKSLNNFFY